MVQRHHKHWKKCRSTSHNDFRFIRKCATKYIVFHTLNDVNKWMEHRDEQTIHQFKRTFDATKQCIHLISDSIKKIEIAEH